jgi:hypothetical protein
MNNQLLQIKINNIFLDKLKRVSEYYHISVSAFVKQALIKKIEELDEIDITENGFSKKEENRIFESIQSLKKEKKNNSLKEYDSLNELLQAIN